MVSLWTRFLMIKLKPGRSTLKKQMFCTGVLSVGRRGSMKRMKLSGLCINTMPLLVEGVGHSLPQVSGGGTSTSFGVTQS